MFGRDGKKQDARRWAAEIDAAADAAVANKVAADGLGGEMKGGEAGANGNLAGDRAGLGREVISTMDARVPESGRNGAAILEAAGERRAIYGGAEQDLIQKQAEIVTEMAEVDNGYGKEYIPGVMTAENESPYEIEQRKKLEAENRWNEDHPNGSRDAKIVAHDQEGHGKVARSVVNGEYLNRDFEVRNLLSWFGVEQNATLNDLENPHPIGKGNG